MWKWWKFGTTISWKKGYAYHISGAVGYIDVEMQPCLSASSIDCENRKDISPQKMKYHALKQNDPTMEMATSLQIYNWKIFKGKHVEMEEACRILINFKMILFRCAIKSIYVLFSTVIHNITGFLCD
jgi:hypothetical protein